MASPSYAPLATDPTEIPGPMMHPSSGSLLATLNAAAGLPHIEPNMRTPSSTVAALLAERRFDFEKPKSSPRPVFKLNGTVIATPGNLVAVVAAAKAGKSSFLSAMCAAAMSPSGDFLGVSSENPNQLPMLHFDTEQSPADHDTLVRSAIRRAGLNNPPSWFYSFCLSGLEPALALACILEATATATMGANPAHSILIDGLADLVQDVNDPTSSNRLIVDLQSLAMHHDCSVVGVLHLNPGSQKQRGHLGSQLERKAESNIRLDRVDEITTVWSAKQRHAAIPKTSGVKFRWSHEFLMHASLDKLALASEVAKENQLQAFSRRIRFCATRL